MDLIYHCMPKIKHCGKKFLKKGWQFFKRKTSAASSSSNGGNYCQEKCLNISNVAATNNRDEAFSYFNHSSQDIKELDFKGFRGWCRVLSVYDGDTMTLAIPFQGRPYKFSVRMEGIDTPEIKGDDKERALEARDRLIELITGKRNAGKEVFKNSVYLVWFECSGFDKYRRLLGKVYSAPSKTNFTDVLIAEKHGYAYYGGTKM
jgi:endonuclease YncB( thermonuclease family)